MNITSTIRALRACTALFLTLGIACAASAQTITLRIVTYNIEADINGYTTARPGLVTPSGGGTVQQGGVLEGIGEEIVGNDPAQPIDILALQETTSNAGTVAPIASALNSFYNTPGMYAYSTYQATESGGNPGSGNGPNACIYNTSTVQLVASVPVDPPGGTGQLGSSSGMYREVMRYEFAPAGVTPAPANEFYIYVSHYKSGTGSANENDRTGEATIIRNDAATNCPANARILYVGDYNISTSTETSYQIMLAASAPNGAVPGQGIDVMNPSGASGVDWTVNSLLNEKSESSTVLHYRDDFQVITTNVYYGTPGGLALVPGTYHVFGNNGTTAYLTGVNSGANTSLTNLQAGAPISAAQLYADLTNASDHLPIVADYTLSIGGPSLAVSPTGSFASTGNQGGPFSPPSQIYTLTNSGTASLTWTATNSSNWLTPSPAAGTLAAGAGTNVTVSISVSANSLAAGTYIDTVAFANTSNGAGSTTRTVSLTVTNTAPLLSISPASGLSSSGPPGGPFSPPSQTYGLTNSGGANLNWTATNTASWLTLSITGGTLAPGTGTNVIVSINANANSLSGGSYSDTISFANLNNGTGNTTRSASLIISSFGFYDDFNTFGAGNLVGQSNWVQYSTQTGAPLQLSGGKVAIAGGQTTDTQDAYKNFPLTSNTVFYGLTLTVTSAVNSTSASYFTALYTSNNATGFANFRLTAKAGDANLTNFVLGGRVTGQSGDPYTFGTTALSFGVQYRVIIQAPLGYANLLIYVNPTSANLASQTAYANNPIGTGTVPASVGSFIISQYGTASVPTDGLSIGKVVVSDSFATVYNALTPVVPPPVASFTGNPTTGAGPLSVAFTDTSTGNITNRLWTFGDGTTTNTPGTNVTHVYTAGTYGVTLVDSGPGGASTNTEPNYITVLTPFQSWQVFYFGSTTNPAAAPTADPDNDGMSNRAEFLVGTDPTNPASVFRIASITQQTNGLLITWTMGAGRTNVLQQADSLDGSGSFTDVVSLLTAGSVTNYLDVGAVTNATPRYYRVRLGP
jgi:PKD repeat protein